MTRILQSNGGHSFAFTEHEATSVQLVGDFTHWLRNPINLKKDAKGTWTTNVPLPRGTHRYKFLVNGHWHDGPEYVVRIGRPFRSDGKFFKSKGRLK